MKPAMVVMYNKNMGGVDMSDKKIYQIAAERPTTRYWVKIFRNIIDMSTRNSYELYKLKNPQSLLSCQDFCAEVVEGLCGITTENSRPPPLETEHVLTPLPNGKERDCVVCSRHRAAVGGTRRRSRTWCPACDLGCYKKGYGLFSHS